MANNIERMIADTFMEMAQGLETGSFGKRPTVALTGMGSEHGEENSMKAAVEAAKDGIDVYYIGTLEAEGVTTIKVVNDEEGHDRMEEMLKNGEVDAAVTMHFPFPIGVSTVGRCVTPATAKEMFIANTTGTSSTDRLLLGDLCVGWDLHTCFWVIFKITNLLQNTEFCEEPSQ